MRLKRLIEGMARTRSGLLVLSGLTAVLSGVEKVMVASLQPRATANRVSAVAAFPAMARVTRTHYFTIRQTRSELGYVYWVLQGFGRFQSFALFDTWAEAMADADRRLASVSAGPAETREVVHQ